MYNASEQFPRLLYVGAVPVESSYSGPTLLYRLLQDYPPDRLMIIETEWVQSLQVRRLCGVEYRSLSTPANRLVKTRFSRWASSWLTLTASAMAYRMGRSLREFAPEAVLTVTHGCSWLTAAQLAQASKLPLHLILHDHWPASTSILPSLRTWQERRFATVYRVARSRLCVSPYMEEEYRHRYGVAGQVLYPSRAKDCPSFDQPPKTYGKRNGSLVGAFAGSIYTRGYARLITTLAASLNHRGGRLMLFGPHSLQALTSWGLNRPNVFPQGLLDSKELLLRLRDEVDFLFVPMQFHDGNEWDMNMRVSFPSKLADYTATGLPLLVCGPKYCSAVRWAQQYSSASEVVTSENLDDIDAAVSRLEHARHRESLGRTAMDVGNQLFSHRTCAATFRKALLF